MKAAKDLLPWKVVDISIRPFDGFWSFNPSIHFDGALWRCVLRCADYAMPSGRTIRSSKARPAGIQTRNAMVIFDPKLWVPTRIFEMREHDQFPRAASANVGFEDMRIFRTDRGGLQGIATASHLKRGMLPTHGGSQPQEQVPQPPEQVLLSFDETYNIATARPIRGDWWSAQPQKNWVPFDNCAEARFLHSIGKGTMFNEEREVRGDAAVVWPSLYAPLLAKEVRPRGVQQVRQDQQPADEELHESAGEGVRDPEKGSALPHESEKHKKTPRVDPRVRLPIRGTDVSIRGVRRAAHDAQPSRQPPSPPPVQLSSAQRDAPRVTIPGSAPSQLPGCQALRGGTQLVRVGEDAWLGIGHEMRYAKGRKLYWHTWYLTNSRGKLTAASPPMKLAPNGIEFAAGLAVDDDRVIVSFGVDDMESKLGETSLAAVLELIGAS